jgi:hypothetical protein
VQVKSDKPAVGGLLITPICAFARTEEKTKIAREMRNLWGGIQRSVYNTAFYVAILSA